MNTSTINLRATIKHLFEQETICGALVFQGGNPSYKGTPEEIKAVMNFLLDLNEKLARALKSGRHYMRNCGANMERDYPEIEEALSAYREAMGDTK